MKKTTHTMQVELTKSEADLMWKLISNARSEIYKLYGDTPYLTEKLDDLLDKFIFPDSEK
jgi:hypothetical protein